MNGLEQWILEIIDGIQYSERTPEDAAKMIHKRVNKIISQERNSLLTGFIEHLKKDNELTETINENDIKAFLIAKELNTKPDDLLIKSPVTYRTIDVYLDELKANQSLKEMAMMRARINLQQFDYLFNLFVSDQQAFKKTYTSYNDVSRHLVFWIERNLDKLPKTNKKHTRL